MTEKDRTFSELSSLLRMVQVIPDADNAARVYQMLLAFCTTWETIGFERAFLFLVDSQDGVLRGQLAAEQSQVLPGAHTRPFEALAKEVFDNYEKIESSDLTLRTRAFEVNVAAAGSAVSQAVRTGAPVLAEARAAEFSADPFLSYFGARCYVAVPIRTGDRMLGVLAADNGLTGADISVSDVSMVTSLVHQAALAITRLIESADSRRRSRILRKLQDILRGVTTAEQIGEAANLSLTMICRAVGGSGCFLRDFVRDRTVHIKTVDEYTVEGDARDVAVSKGFLRVLERCAQSMQPVHGDHQHPLLSEEVAGAIAGFTAIPLLIGGDSLGAMAVYIERDDDLGARTRFDHRDRTFLELCAGMLAERFNALHLTSRAGRLESMLEEARAGFVRERDEARAGSRALEFQETVETRLDELRQVIVSRAPFEKRVRDAREILDQFEEDTEVLRADVELTRKGLVMMDLFGVVRDAARAWSADVTSRGVEVTLRIPERGPSMLLDRHAITAALDGILGTLSNTLNKDDRAMVECSADADRAVILVADTGDGLPGDLLSRLFMPFGASRSGDDRNSMSVAGDIVRRHGGEIMLRSSPSWKTILVITFPAAGNSDRRTPRRDRRRRNDRRKISTRSG